MVTIIHCPSMEMAANAWLRPHLCPQREVPAKLSLLTSTASFLLQSWRQTSCWSILTHW